MEVAGEMFYQDELIPATFENSLNRFVAVVKFNDNICNVHIPTTSRMRELLYPGANVFISYNSGKNRKTQYDLKAVIYNGILVSIDSGVPNKILQKALSNHDIDKLSDWSLDKCEVVYGNSRLDFRLSRGGEIMYVEAKSVTLVNEGWALFPDAPTSRGTRHLFHLINAVENGHQASVIFIIQREDANSFSPNTATDPVFAAALKEAYNAGVQVLPLKCIVTAKSIKIVAEVPIIW
jgi:sugar fermentation stimulation protein A